MKCMPYCTIIFPFCFVHNAIPKLAGGARLAKNCQKSKTKGRVNTEFQPQVAGGILYVSPKALPLRPVGGVTSARNVTLSCQNAFFTGNDPLATKRGRLGGRSHGPNRCTRTRIRRAALQAHLSKLTMSILVKCAYA